MPRSTADPRNAEIRMLMTRGLKRRAAEFATRTHRSLSSLAVDALEEYLDRKESNPLLELAGAWKDEPADLTQRIRTARNNRRTKAPSW